MECGFLFFVLGIDFRSGFFFFLIVDLFFKNIFYCLNFKNLSWIVIFKYDGKNIFFEESFYGTYSFFFLLFISEVIVRDF